MRSTILGAIHILGCITQLPIPGCLKSCHHFYVVLLIVPAAIQIRCGSASRHAAAVNYFFPLSPVSPSKVTPSMQEQQENGEVAVAALKRAYGRVGSKMEKVLLEPAMTLPTKYPGPLEQMDRFAARPAPASKPEFSVLYDPLDPATWPKEEPLEWGGPGPWGRTIVSSNGLKFLPSTRSIVSDIASSSSRELLTVGVVHRTSDWLYN